MPKLDTTPETLKVYQFHGVDFTRISEQAEGDCPFCDRPKFSVRVADGIGRCWSASCPSHGLLTATEKEGFNPTSFVRMLHALSYDATRPEEYQSLVDDRGFNNSDVLMVWGVCKSLTTRDWLIPGFNAKGNLCTLYRYIKIGQRMTLMPTPTLGHHIFGMQEYSQSKSICCLTEGPWDGMKLWEVIRQAKESDSGLSLTNNVDASLFHDVNVLAIPGCGSVGKPLQRWRPLFVGKRVWIMFDSDHPKRACAGCRKSYSIHSSECLECGQTERQGPLQPSAGYATMQRAADMLGAAEVQYIHWGDAGYDPNLPDGADVRWYLNAEDS